MTETTLVETICLIDVREEIARFLGRDIGEDEPSLVTFDVPMAAVPRLLRDGQYLIAQVPVDRLVMV